MVVEVTSTAQRDALLPEAFKQRFLKKNGAISANSTALVCVVLTQIAGGFKTPADG